MRFAASLHVIPLLLLITVERGQCETSADEPPAAENRDDAARDKAQEYYSDGVKAIKAGDFPAAVSHLQKAVEQLPRNAQVRAALGVAYFQMQRPMQAWSQFRHAIRLNPQNARVVNSFMQMWNSFDRRGLFLVGTEPQQLTKAIGAPDRVLQTSDGERWLYGFMAVDFRDDKLHTIIDRRGFGEKERQSTERLAVQTDQRDWKIKHRMIDRRQKHTTYFLADQMPPDWSERLTTQQIFGNERQRRPGDVLDRTKKRILKVNPDAKFEILEESEQEAIYEWRTGQQGQRPPQHCIARLVLGEKDVHRIAFVVQVDKMSADLRDSWIELLRRAEVVRDEPASGKSSAEQLDVPAISDPGED